MDLKDILVPLDAATPYDSRLDVAAALARRHGAHLTGLFVLDPLRETGLATGIVGSGNSVALLELIDEVRDEALRAAEQAEARFRERVRRDGLEGEWRCAEGRPGETIALHARYADLTVLGQDDPEVPRLGEWGAVIEEVLFSSGRPVLIVPYAGRFEAVGRRVLVGWNGSREAARAVGDALPLLKQAEAVTVLAVDPRRGVQGAGALPAADMALHLARHGLTVTAAHEASAGLSEADVLLNHAADLSADLLVVGAYGHSRLREVIMGGVTRSLLGRMTVPVLMSH